MLPEVGGGTFEHPMPHSLPRPRWWSLIEGTPLLVHRFFLHDVRPRCGTVPVHALMCSCTGACGPRTPAPLPRRHSSPRHTASMSVCRVVAPVSRNCRGAGEAGVQSVAVQCCKGEPIRFDSVPYEDVLKALLLRSCTGQTCFTHEL